MDILERIHALRGASKLYVDAAFEKADDNYRHAREVVRYKREDLHASEADDREIGLLQSSQKTDDAQVALDEAEAKLKVARDRLEVERKRFSKVFLAELDGTAKEVANLTLALSNAVQALQGHAFAIASFASQRGLAIHRALDHAASLDAVVRRLRHIDS